MLKDQHQCIHLLGEIEVQQKNNYSRQYLVKRGSTNLLLTSFKILFTRQPQSTMQKLTINSKASKQTQFYSLRTSNYVNIVSYT